MDNAASQFYSSETPARKKSKTKAILFLVLLVVIAALAIFGTMRFLKARNSAMELSPSPTEEFSIPTEPPTATEEVSPTGSASAKASATPTPTTKPTISTVDKATGLDRSKLTVEIQNGSGVAGAAGKVKTALEDLGYIVSKTGNADNYDYTKMVINVRATKKSYLPLLQKDLESDYTIGSTSADLTSSSADALIIVGK